MEHNKCAATRKTAERTPPSGSGTPRTDQPDGHKAGRCKKRWVHNAWCLRRPTACLKQHCNTCRKSIVRAKNPAKTPYTSEKDATHESHSHSKIAGGAAMHIHFTATVARPRQQHYTTVRLERFIAERAADAEVSEKQHVTSLSVQGGGLQSHRTNHAPRELEPAQGAVLRRSKNLTTIFPPHSAQAKWHTIHRTSW